MSNLAIELFPANAPTISISVTATASSAVALPQEGSTLRVVNTGPSTAYIVINPVSLSAVATVPSGSIQETCTPVLAGSDICLNIPGAALQYISAICAAGQTTTLVASVAEGF